jgi:DNA-directed RNA polymerase subunit RPC12/RpoP
MNNALIISVHIKGENVTQLLWICLKCKKVFKQKKAAEPRNCPSCKSQVIIKEGMDERRKK